MVPFVYRCPATGYNVQGFIPDSRSDKAGDAALPVSCALCGRIHLIDPKTLQVPAAGARK